jgi:hypothetical protein
VQRKKQPKQNFKLNHPTPKWFCASLCRVIYEYLIKRWKLLVGNFELKGILVLDGLHHFGKQIDIVNTT